MADNFSFLHIKKHTAGSSNELSLDVLDHKRAEADARTTRGSMGSKAPNMTKVDKGRYQGMAGTTALSRQAEVRERKEARRVRRTHMHLLVAAVAVALVGVGVFAFTLVQDEKADHSVQIKSLVDRLSDVDETLVKADSLMENPFDEEAASERSEVLKASNSLKTELNRISVDAQLMEDLSLGDTESIVVRQISEAAQTRSTMLDAAVLAFRYVDEAASTVEEANTVWNSVLNSDHVAREAISEANRATTREATSQSLDKLREAHAGFETALSNLRDISAKCGVDFSEETAYLETKLESLDHAVATSEALLAGDRATAKTENDAYNTVDALAAKLAEQLPPSIGPLVLAQYQENVVDYWNRYEETREKVIAADSVIRDYLNGQAPTAP